jgi:hypothetical protein
MDGSRYAGTASGVGNLTVGVSCIFGCCSTGGACSKRACWTCTAGTCSSHDGSPDSADANAAAATKFLNTCLKYRLICNISAVALRWQLARRLSFLHMTPVLEGSVQGCMTDARHFSGEQASSEARATRCVYVTLWEADGRGMRVLGQYPQDGNNKRLHTRMQTFV